MPATVNAVSLIDHDFLTNTDDDEDFFYERFLYVSNGLIDGNEFL
jgi:hypothetical protein